MSWKTCGIVRLRAHHLLCILTFAGKGYSPAFVANMAGVVARIGAGEPIEVVAGPDDICAPLEGAATRIAMRPPSCAATAKRCARSPACGR